MAQATIVRCFVNRALLRYLPSTTRASQSFSFSQSPIQQSPIPETSLLLQIVPDSKKRKINTKVNFSLSNSDDEKTDKTKLPPPYDPFSKTPAVEKVEEARELLKEMEDLGFLPDEKGVREALSCKRGQVFRTVINVLFDK